MTVEPELSQELADGAKAFADVAVVVISRFSGEGWDRSSIECNNEFNPWDTETTMPKIPAKFSQMATSISLPGRKQCFPW